METIPGLKVDYQKIAEGMYDLFTEQDKAVTAFGMLPADKMNCAEKLFREKCAKDEMKRFEIPEDPDEVAKWAKAVKSEVVHVFNKNLAVAILGVAKAHNALMV